MVSPHPVRRSHTITHDFFKATPLILPWTNHQVSAPQVNSQRASASKRTPSYLRRTAAETYRWCGETIGKSYKNWKIMGNHRETGETPWKLMIFGIYWEWLTSLMWKLYFQPMNSWFVYLGVIQPLYLWSHTYKYKCIQCLNCLLFRNVIVSWIQFLITNPPLNFQLGHLTYVFSKWSTMCLAKLQTWVSVL